MQAFACYLVPEKLSRPRINGVVRRSLVVVAFSIKRSFDGRRSLVNWLSGLGLCHEGALTACASDAALAAL